MVQAFRRSLGTQIIANAGACTADKYFNVGCAAVSRRPGQTMSQWIETEEDPHHLLLKGTKPSILGSEKFWQRRLKSRQRALLRTN